MEEIIKALEELAKENKLEFNCYQNVVSNYVIFNFYNPKTWSSCGFHLDCTKVHSLENTVNYVRYLIIDKYKII